MRFHIALLALSLPFSSACDSGGSSDTSDGAEETTGDGTGSDASGTDGEDSSGAEDGTTDGTGDTTGDTDDTTGDTGDTTGGDGDGDGVVYIADPSGLATVDLATGESAHIGDLLPGYVDALLEVGPSDDLLLLPLMGTNVIDTTTGESQITMPFTTNGHYGWVDEDSILVDDVLSVTIRSVDGAEEASFSPQGGGYASRWFVSPDGTKIAVKAAQTGVISIYAITGGSDPVAEIGNPLDCTPPTWLADGTLVGVCINSQEFYYAAESDSETTHVALEAPEHDVTGSTIWTGDDTILVNLRSNGSGGAVGQRYVVMDSSGAQVEDVEWLGALPGSAGLDFSMLHISADDSTVVFADGGPELWRANVDGSNLEEFDPVSTLVLAFAWDRAK